VAHGGEEGGPALPRVLGVISYKPGQLKETKKFMSLLGKISELKWHVKEVAPIFSTMTVYLPLLSRPVPHRHAASSTPSGTLPPPGGTSWSFCWGVPCWYYPSGNLPRSRAPAPLRH